MYIILYYNTLCYAMLCYAMLCYAMLCYAMLCYNMEGSPCFRSGTVTTAPWTRSVKHLERDGLLSRLVCHPCWSCFEKLKLSCDVIVVNHLSHHVIVIE